MSEIKFSVFEVFEQTAETLQEAEERSRLEQGRPQVDRFRTSEDGTYSVRVLPLAPEVERNEKGEIISVKPLEDKGFEYPLQQLFLDIQLPEKNGKARKISVPVIRSSAKPISMSGDLIDTYINIVREKYANDEDVVKKVTSGSFEGGLKWSHQRVMYILNLEEKTPKIMLYQVSYAQYKQIDDARIRLWKEERDDNENAGCPLTSISNAYPLTIIRNTKNNKVEYNFELARKKRPLKEEEAIALLEAPKIPEIIYHFSRYQLEAEKVALEQYDERHKLSVTSEQEFKDMYDQLLGELPKDDNSHFDLNTVGKEEKGADGDVTLDSLFERYDEIADKGLGKTSDEYKALREDIRMFVQENNVDVYLSRNMDNLEMLEAIEKAVKEGAFKKEPEKEDTPDEKEEPKVETPRRRRAPRPTEEEQEQKEPEKVEVKEEPQEEEKADEGDEEPVEELPRRRRRR